MPIRTIPIHRLSDQALKGVIEEFISREGTDYGEKEIPHEIKFYQIKHRLERGRAILVFDDKTRTTNILSADNPMLKEIEKGEQ